MRSSDRDMNIDTPTTRRPCFSSCVKPVSRMGSYSSLAYQSIRKWHQTAMRGGRKACTSKELENNVGTADEASAKGMCGSPFPIAVNGLRVFRIGFCVKLF